MGDVDLDLTELVDGQLAAPAGPPAAELEDPNDGRALGTLHASTAARVEAALATAASSTWSQRGLDERAAALEALADALDARASEIALAEAIDTGVPIAVTEAIAGSLGGTIRGAVATARAAGEERLLPAGGRRVELLRRPWGPAALLAPWNAPAPVAVSKLAHALIAGCPAILKPSEHAPQAAGLIARAAVEAGLPADALAVVHGGPPVALQLAADRRVAVVSLTGGLAAGRAVAAAAIERMAALQLELGASNPALVCDDADIAAAAAALAAGATKLNGQWCEAPRRVFVHARRHDELLDALRGELAALPIGSSLERSTALGPLARRAHRDRVLAQVRSLGGAPVSAGEAPQAGAFLAPTLVPGLAPDAVGEEIFGPVLTLHPVAGDGIALAAANATGDGLAGYVFSADDERAFDLGRRLRAGEVRLGGTHLLDLAPGSAQSFWGTSGIGGHGAREALEAYRGTRIVGVDDPALPI
jgi:phenylacetaldehyde dehydrogenase